MFRDFWELEVTNRAEKQITRLDKEWKLEFTKEDPSLSRAVFNANKRFILPCCFLHLCLMTISRLVPAFINQQILEWLVLGKTDNSVYIWVGLLALATCSRAFFWSYSFEFIEILSHRLRVQLNTLVYQKILRLSLNGFNQTSIGTIINYIANDTMFSERAVAVFCLFTGAPIMIVVSTTLLIWMSGWAGVIGLATYLVLFFMVAVVTSKTGALRSKTGKIADQRISLMEEMLNAIQVVKMSGRGSLCRI